MSQRRIRRAAAAAALAAVLAFAAPAHSAGWETWTLEPGWIGKALQWIAHAWTGEAPEEGRNAATAKSDAEGMDPDGATATTSPSDMNSDQGMGVDPDG